MAESRSEGAKLYHERRGGSTHSVVHCINTLLQGPLFDESGMAAIAIELDRRERLNIVRKFGLPTNSSGYFRFDIFGVQVELLQEALKAWDMQVTPLHSPEAWEAKIDFEQESAMICQKGHKEDWTCVRRVDGEWYEFDCLYPAPEHVPEFYVPAYVDSLECFGWTIYLVRGKLPGTRDTPAARARDDDGPPSSREDEAEGNRDEECAQA
ncbi:putative ataxin-3 homolog [Syzygium oleosum]|uniref:putative ataxin-3 homolog n=1 Tax=Syzygium oleosum TaxID=219896 RepID=UPI0011D18E20|nr:putative ataxin-3 homolog [Syzygium oleosum]